MSGCGKPGRRHRAGRQRAGPLVLIGGRGERQLAGQHLEGDHAGRVHVGGPAHRLRAVLAFRRDVRRVEHLGEPAEDAVATGGPRGGRSRIRSASPPPVCVTSTVAGDSARCSTLLACACASPRSMSLITRSFASMAEGELRIGQVQQQRAGA